MSFEGAITIADSATIQIDAIEGQKHIAIYQIRPLSEFDILGGFAQVGDSFHLALTVAKKCNFENAELPRTHLNAQWPLPKAKIDRLN